MSDIVEDFEGKKFEIAGKGTDNEVWISVENPDWKFETINMSKYQGDDALVLGLPYSISCDAEENLEEVMPIIDKMFLPTYKSRYIQKLGNIICVCNASKFPSSKYEESVFAASAYAGPRYWDEHTLYLKPGTTSLGHGESDDKLYLQIRKEKSLKCLDLIEERESISYLDTTENLYFEKLADLMEQAIKENAENRFITLAEKISEKAISKYDEKGIKKEINYERQKAIFDFWAKIVSSKPELAEKGNFYISKSQNAYLSIEPYMKLGNSQDYDYLKFLQKALSYASDENRIKILEKIGTLVKNTPELSSYQMYQLSSYHMYYESNRKDLISQNKHEEKILTDILKTTASKDTNVFLHLYLLKEKPELASTLLPIMGQVMMNKDYFSWDNEAGKWVMDHYGQYKNIIKSSKGLMKALDDIFTQKVALEDLSIIPSLEGISRENFDAFAKIYEDEYASATYNIDKDNIKQKNVVLGKENNEIMDTIKTKILESSRDYYDASISKPVQVWLVKNAQKYPNLVSECLKTAELPYVEMCIKNIKNPEKENIGSLLNRLEVKEAKTFEDFQDAQDFVARRDMCMRATGGYKQLSYDMAEIGVSDFRTAKRVNDLFIALNKRPDTYNSSYNLYHPKDLLPIAKSNVMQDWMYPVMMDAIEKGGLTISEGRMPSERTLFDCCKAWKINPAMPQKLAKFVGTHSLKGRMLAGAIFDKMVTDGKTTVEEWRDNKILHEKFYEELARADKMPREKAFQQYIPNTPVNRKRVVGMGMEEKGIENTPENFKALYCEACEKGIFDKMLAKPEEAKTTFSSRLLVEAARIKFNKTK